MARDVTFSDVMTNPLRTGLFTTLREMGASIEESEVRGGCRRADGACACAPPNCAASRCRRSVRLDDRRISGVLCGGSLLAEGTTIMRGLQELRVKESDRLEATAAMLRVNGIKVEIGGR